MRWVAIPIFSIPIVVGWIFESILNITYVTKIPDQSIVIIRTWDDVADSIIILLSLLATLILYGLIFRQVQSQQKSVKMQTEALKITKDDFDRRNKILILEVSEKFNNIRYESRWKGIVRVIRNSNNDERLKRDLTEWCNRDDDQNPRIQDFRFIFDSCEEFFIKCKLLDLDLNVIDEIMGIEICDIFRNDVIWKYKEKIQRSFPDAYTNIDSVYPKMERIRKKKNM